MAYDVNLADRVRGLLVDGSPVTEQKMFGGLAFLVDGDDLHTERQLAQWIAIGTTTATSAPAKSPHR